MREKILYLSEYSKIREKCLMRFTQKILVSIQPGIMFTHFYGCDGTLKIEKSIVSKEVKRCIFSMNRYAIPINFLLHVVDANLNCKALSWLFIGTKAFALETI